ncbi:MAG TPA: hypothetical protein VI299_08375 [Polyangiales bacterium]
MTESVLPGVRPWKLFSLSLLWLGACTRARPVEPVEATPRAAVTHPTSAAASGLYSAQDALRDLLSSPLQHIGTGRWPGIRRMFACAYRNQRVLVVDAYCAPAEKQAFRVDVYSPSRGRVRLYAETRGTVSTRRREDYFTFMVESEPPLTPASPPLTIPFPELSAYEQQRYDAFLPACFAGQELQRSREGCLGALSARSRAWSEQHRAFVAHPSEDFYRAVRELRALAVRHGREPD